MPAVFGPPECRPAVFWTSGTDICRVRLYDQEDPGRWFEVAFHTADLYRLYRSTLPPELPVIVADLPELVDAVELPELPGPAAGDELPELPGPAAGDEIPF